MGIGDNAVRIVEDIDDMVADYTSARANAVDDFVS